jgi:hypothetical protein
VKYWEMRGCHGHPPGEDARVVLHDDDGVAGLNQFIELGHGLFDVGPVESVDTIPPARFRRDVRSAR